MSRAAVAVLLAALVAFQSVSTDLYLPSLPTIVADLATTVEDVQLTLSLFLVGFGAGQLLWGPLADRFGRRPVLLAGLAAYVAAAIGCALAPGIGTLVALRTLHGVAAAVGPSIGRAVVRDLWAPRDAQRVLGYLAAAMALGPMFGPIAGGVLTEHFGWRANFWALAVFGTVVLIATVLVLGETVPRYDPAALRPRRLLEAYGTVLAHPLFRASVLAAAFSYAGIFVWISSSPHVLVGVLGVAPSTFGLAFALSVAGYMVGSFTGARLARRLGPTAPFGLGGALAAVNGVLAALTLTFLPPGLALVLPFAFLVMVSTGFVLPASMAASLAPFPGRAGLASGLLGALQLAVASGIGYLVAAAFDGSARPMAWGWAAVGLATLAAARATAIHAGHELAEVPAALVRRPATGQDPAERKTTE